MKKKLLILSVSFSLCAFLFVVNSNAALPKKYFQYKESKQISSGVQLLNYKQFTASGWLSYDVLKINLKNPDVKVDTITDKTSLSNRKTTLELAKASSAVAAVNANFFIYGNNNKGYPIGALMQDNKPLAFDSITNSKTNTYATLSISSANQAFVKYWKTTSTVKAPNGKSMAVSRMNQHYAGYEDLSIYDQKYTSISFGKEHASSMLEMFVDANGIVTDIRKGKTQQRIPNGGYIVVTRYGTSSPAASNFISNNFKVGDKVTLTTKSSPYNWNTLKTAVTGSSIVLNNGKIPSKFSHEASNSSRAARTIVGTSKSGSTLYMVTVDCLTYHSFGLTLKDTGSLLKGLGIYNAVNLDGGGSTTMVSKTDLVSSVKLINRPTAASQRPVPAAFGVFSLGTKGNANSLKITTNDDHMFKNTKIDLSATQMDAYFNQTSIPNPKNIKWSFSGVKGSISGSIFTPKTSGTVKLTATYNGLKGTKTVVVQDSPPVSLTISNPSNTVDLNTATTFSLVAKSPKGYRVKVSPASATWTITGNLGTFNNNGVFTAKKSGSGYIKAKIGKTTAYAKISVSGIVNNFKNDFETAMVSAVHPEISTIAIATDIKNTGASSNKITYNLDTFALNEKTYFNFITAANISDTYLKEMSLFVYNTVVSENSIGFTDSKGTAYYLSQKLDWTGWKELRIPINALTVTNLFIEKKDVTLGANTIYIDTLSSYSSVFPAAYSKGLPKNKTIKGDTDKKKVKAPFTFSVFGQTKEAKTSLEKTVLNKYFGKVKNLSVVSMVGNTSHKFPSSVKGKKISTYKGHKSFTKSGSLFVQVDSSKQGLHSSKQSELDWFFKKVKETTKAKNIFIFYTNPLTSFNDYVERDLIKKRLETIAKNSGKNIWVFSKGTSNKVKTSNGVKYFSSVGMDIAGLSKNKKSVKYYEISIKKNIPTYTLKSVY